MSEVGSIGWIDLTVEGADELRSFYEAVVGWKSEGVDMGGYSDYSMCTPGSGDAKAGVCHARGSNEGIPPVWMIYIVVENLDEALASCTEHGGKVLRDPQGNHEHGRTAIIADPQGTVCSLFQPGA